MKAEDLYTKIVRWKNRCDDVETREEMSEVLCKLSDEMAEKIAKESGISKIVKAAKNIVKNVDEYHKDVLGGTFKMGEKWAICDGYRVVRFTEKLPIEEVSYSGNLYDVFDQDFIHEIQVPKVSEIKEFVLNAKATLPKGIRKNSVPSTTFAYKVSDNPRVFVDARLLIDVLECLPNSKAYVANNFAYGVHFVADNGDGVLMPVRVPKDFEAGEVWYV